MDFLISKSEETMARIKVVGVGGAGNNAVNRMIEEGIRGVEFIAINCDAQDLNYCLADNKLLIGEQTTRGLGAGGNPQIGEAAAVESKSQIVDLLKNTDMVFITAGMGGGTGTGAAPVVAECAKELGILTVAVVSKPFKFEAKKRMRQAIEGMERLSEHVDTLIPIPNEALMKVIDKKTTIKDAFKLADTILCHGVEGITSLISVPGFINLDFADIQSVMRNAGTALMGVGTAEGGQAAMEAADAAIKNPLLEHSIDGAKGVIVNICGDESLTLYEVNEAIDVIQQAVDEEANIIFGTTIDEHLQGTIRVSVIATGFSAEKESVLDPVAPDKPWDKPKYNKTKEPARNTSQERLIKPFDLPSFMRKNY